MPSMKTQHLPGSLQRSPLMKTCARSYSLSTFLAVTLAIALQAMPCYSAVWVDFGTSNQGWTAAVESGSSANPFLWSSSAGIGGEGAWYTAGSAVSSIITLSSPQFTIASDGAVTLSIQHRYNFEEFSGFAIDGGQLRYRVNSGSWTLVNASSFTANGYHGSTISALGGAQGWSSTSAGYSTPSYVTSSASFGNFTAGDTLQIQFRAGWDNSIANSSPNWMLNELSVNNVVPEPATTGILAALSLVGFAMARQWRKS